MIFRLMISFAAAYVTGMGSLHAQSQTGGAAKEIVLRPVAADLYFLYDQTSSNAAFLVTDEGVLVVDTRQHPRDGEDLLNRIRAITNKPIKWVVNSHFHADHTYGNQVFKAAGATIIAHRDTARIMQQVNEKELARRQWSGVNAVGQDALERATARTRGTAPRCRRNLHCGAPAEAQQTCEPISLLATAQRSAQSTFVKRKKH
jgi:glyoxylase-like metal-dependent hydrolase (beta-lactamase superfamily II)